jgi:zinc protease
MLFAAMMLVLNVSGTPANVPVDTTATPVGPSLLDRPPTPGRVVKEEVVSSIGVTIWTLSNGMRVILKPTAFHQDQVLIKGYSWGGASRLPLEDRTAVRTGNVIFRDAGLGRFDSEGLMDVLRQSGVVSMSRVIAPDREAISGIVSTSGTPTLLQLIHLIFTSQRIDTAVARRLIAQARPEFKMAGDRLQETFRDSTQAALWQHHPRSGSYSLEEIERTDVNRVFTVLRDRFADASGFTITIVGSFTVSQLRGDIERYLASLPALHRKQRWSDNGIRYPDSIVKIRFSYGTNRGSWTSIIFNSPVAKHSPESPQLSVLAEILGRRIEARLRTAIPGSYNMRVTPAFERYPVPRVLIYADITTLPEYADGLPKVVLEEAEKLSRDGPTEEEMVVERQKAVQALEDIVETNDFWAQILESYSMTDQPWSRFSIDADIKTMSRASLQSYAKEYLNVRRYVQVTQLPLAP